jgi:hypothetical protein
VEETANWILRIIAFIGIGVFLWSLADSVEKIAQAFRRIASAMEKGGGVSTPLAEPKE